MLSLWKVRTVSVAGSTFYEVYRTTDAAREKDRVERYGGYWTTEKEAKDLAARLNDREGNTWN